MHKGIHHIQGIAIIGMMVAMLVCSACSPSHKGEVDELNYHSYAFHYRNLDSTKVLAEKALALSEDYPAGYAEACNNMAFVATAKMDFRSAKQWLGKVNDRSDNQIELLIADVQNMRLCQREARNKDFYSYRENAMRRLRRIGEEVDNLPLRERRRAIYAKSEFDIVTATYFYYVQQDKPMQEALANLDPDELEQDTAQYLNYLYNFGSGGAITNGTSNEIAQQEFDMLIRLYMLASGSNPYPYWQANALQAISEHIQSPEQRDFLVKNNLPAFQYLNVEQMPVELLAGNLAQRALNLFSEYGDVYQTAGAYRTLAECYWQIKDYNSAGQCLNRALTQNKAIMQAPDLVASIRERLCLVYSAIDNKQQSDYNRNIYLDLQEQTRQDRQLEARAAQLDYNAVQLNYYDYGKMKYFETMKHGLINWHEAELVIVNLNINFFVPIFMGDDIRVRTKIYEIGRKSVKLIQVLYDEKTKQIKSMCDAVMCGFDVNTNTSTLISEEWRRLITGFEGDVIQKQLENK